MRFRRHIAIKGRALAVAAASFVLLAGPAAADTGYAIVPVTTIYPGETITESRVKAVEVTNPNLAPGYASSIEQVIGMVSRRTLVAGRTIQVGTLREPFTVQRGTPVRLVARVGNLTISASGTPLADAMTGDVIRVRNLDSGVTVNGTVMADGTVEVMKK
ncbi:flagellar basal body P-ring formation chaperone FlgA [Rhizobiaceae bacterium BDR2-2]|uniref:Flagella basal body P-ring formation protein FlgA n=1 Tax=Ectorhizobium quercum TaxID=2965071 RepID=A0AAE3MXY9_9HYPH|nr:flagellar basal body P-ring formation chaperone FlgA [Ectorhizobium quercum]MCX8996104.1 flagellar basal body P-ring formation chaperone FlgA [Ectorhizobium quercum]